MKARILKDFDKLIYNEDSDKNISRYKEYIQFVEFLGGKAINFNHTECPGGAFGYFPDHTDFSSLMFFSDELEFIVRKIKVYYE